MFHWRRRARQHDRGDVTASHVVWSTPKGSSFVPSPLLLGDYLYTVNDMIGVVSCHHAKTGELVGQLRLGEAKGPDRNNFDTLDADASRRAALLVASMFPTCAFLAPCRAGASTPKVAHLFRSGPLARRLLGVAGSGGGEDLLHQRRWRDVRPQPGSGLQVAAREPAERADAGVARSGRRPMVRPHRGPPAGHRQRHCGPTGKIGARASATALKPCGHPGANGTGSRRRLNFY